jgi:nitroimidazol reductase NimA-like FMN-containing flavoprotein (pyridoxamine 5'-phosphate oxidase superfamily)
MLGTLTDIQTNNLLTRNAVGRIGYHDEKKSYITPVTYVFDGEYIIGQTNEGLKLDIMRKNPFVCFEVDVMSSMSNWESVIAWGYFEELFDNEALDARKYLYNSILDLLTVPSVHPHEHDPNILIDDSNRIKGVMYRIKITEKIGRFESR